MKTEEDVRKEDREKVVIRAALTMCKRFPDVLPASNTYAELLSAYKVLFHAGKDTYETDREARDRIGTKTGEEILRVFRTAPAEALASLGIEI